MFICFGFGWLLCRCFWANRVAPEQLQMEQTLPPPRANCLTHCMLAFHRTISVQWVYKHANSIQLANTSIRKHKQAKTLTTIDIVIWNAPIENWLFSNRCKGLSFWCCNVAINYRLIWEVSRRRMGEMRCWLIHKQAQRRKMKKLTHQLNVRPFNPLNGKHCPLCPHHLLERLLLLW